MTSIRKEITINNVVCTTDLQQKILIKTFNKYKYLSCNLDLYKCGYVKDDTMQGRVTVFPSGKLISVGTSSPRKAVIELKKACSLLKKYNLISNTTIKPKIRNIAANTSFGFNLNLEKLAINLPRAMYEPGQFAGVVYRMSEKVVAMIFGSGKVVIVGSKSIDELNSAYFELEKRIKITKAIIQPKLVTKK